MDVKINNNKLSRFELIFLILSAVVTITFVSASSPLYPFNPWDDVNVFFTVGRGMINGMVPYRDIFDHKGPLLYFLFAFAALISQKSFVGVWIVESIFASVFSVFSWKIVRLFAKPSKFAIVLMPLFLSITYTSGMFNFGGNSEELCFPLLTVAFYFGLRSIVLGDGLPTNIEALISGILTAALFWIKYTFLGFMIGFCLYILCITVKRKDFKRLWSLVWRYLAGVIGLSIPVLLYYAANKSLDYLWEGYFYDNLFLYLVSYEPQGVMSIPVIKNVFLIFFYLGKTVKDFPTFGVLLGLSALSVFFIDRKYRKKTVLLSLITFFFLTGVVYSRVSNIFYYSYILYYAFGFSMVTVIKGINFIKEHIQKDSSLYKFLFVTLFTVLYASSILLCKNMYLIFKPKDYLAQFRIAETINETPDAKILTYDLMDSGFYTAAELLPSNRFCAPKNFDEGYHELRDEQDRLIDEGYFDYVITSYFCEREISNYELVQEETCTYVDQFGVRYLEGYKLYKRL